MQNVLRSLSQIGLVRAVAAEMRMLRHRIESVLVQRQLRRIGIRLIISGDKGPCGPNVWHIEIGLKSDRRLPALASVLQRYLETSGDTVCWDYFYPRSVYTHESVEFRLLLQSDGTLSAHYYRRPVHTYTLMHMLQEICDENKFTRISNAINASFQKYIDAGFYTPDRHTETAPYMALSRKFVTPNDPEDQLYQAHTMFEGALIELGVPKCSRLWYQYIVQYGKWLPRPLPFYFRWTCASLFSDIATNDQCDLNARERFELLREHPLEEIQNHLKMEIFPDRPV